MQIPPLQAVADSVLVHMPERQITSLSITGADGKPMQLYFDPTWAEQENKILRGVVLAPPAALTRSYFLQRSTPPKDRAHWHIAYKSDIQEELRAGDIVYTDWAVSEPTFELPGLGGVYYCSIGNIVAIVREGQIIPYASYVLLEAVYPDDVEEVEVLGKKMHLRVSTSGLTMGSEDIPPVPGQGRIVHIGLPLRGQPARLAVGDRVVLDKKYLGHGGLPLKVNIEGRDYHCIRQDYIVAILTPQP